MAIVEGRGRVFAGDLSHRLEFDQTANGPSLVAGWEAADGTLTVRADRLGMVPLFHWRSGDHMIVSDSLAEISRRLPRPRFDRRAVAAYLHLGYFLGDATPIEGVKAMLPGATLTWDGDCAVSAPVFPDPAAFDGSREEATAEYRRLFQLAIDERVAGGVGRMTLSGGRDSRHILFALAAAGNPPPSLLTLDRGNSDDHEIARRLAQALDIECLTLGMPAGSIEAELAKNRINHYLSDENSWYLALLDALAGPVFDGLAGDVLSNGLYFDDAVAALVASGRVDEGAARFMDRFGAHLTFIAPKFRQLWSRELALAAVTEEFERVRATPDPVKAFVFWNRTRREIALLPLCMASRKAPVRLPYLAPALLKFLLSLPFRPFGPAGFHDHVIDVAYPDLNGIPYATKRHAGESRGAVLRFVAGAVRHAVSGVTSTPHMFAYAAQAAARGSVKPIGNAFSRVLPLVQAHRELGVSYS